MRRYVLNRVLFGIGTIILVMISLGHGSAVMVESGPSFLSVCIQLPQTASGTLISGRVSYLSSVW